MAFRAGGGLINALSSPSSLNPAVAAAAGQSIGGGLGQMLTGRREAQAQQRQQQERTEAAGFAGLARVPAKQRGQYIDSLINSGVYDQDDIGVLNNLKGQTPEQQDAMIFQTLSAGGYQDLLPQGTSGKVGTIRYIDTGANIEARDTRTNELIETIPKTSTKSEQAEQRLKAEKQSLDVEERKEKQQQKKVDIAKSAQGVIDQANTGLQLISDLKAHPGFSDVVGVKGPASLFGLLEDPIGGTDAAGAKAIIDTLESQNFIAGIQQFKASGGAGALSDSEGKKLASAIASLKTSQSEKDFKKSLSVVERLLKKQASQARRDIPKGFKVEEAEVIAPTGNIGRFQIEVID